MGKGIFKSTLCHNGVIFGKISMKAGVTWNWFVKHALNGCGTVLDDQHWSSRTKSCCKSVERWKGKVFTLDFLLLVLCSVFCEWVSERVSEWVKCFNPCRHWDYFLKEKDVDVLVTYCVLWYCSVVGFVCVLQCQMM
jgi:hypothetical protein